jgi:hypothetical protein
MRRRWQRALAFLTLAGLALTLWCYGIAVSAPVVRRASIAILPLGTPPLRAVLLSDIHVAGPDMPPERLARIVAQVNALAPDIVLIAGDFVGDGYLQRRIPPAEAVRPFAALRARLGTWAVLGNHDHWNDPSAIRIALAASNVRLLTNQAAQVGPLALGGLDDDFTGRADLAATLARMRGLSGTRLILSHSPDPFADTPADVPLFLAGHTHCGQLRFPLVGALTYEIRNGARFGCGEVNEEGRRLIVSAGLGTSVLPFRLGAVPDLWLIELRPVPAPVPPR